MSYCTSVAKVGCAAALAATGHLTSVENMVLWNLELPSTEDISSLARLVSDRVLLIEVTGDLGPLLSSLTCPELVIKFMEMDQAATSSGVSNNVRLDGVTGDLGPLLSSLTCTELQINNMELDQAATCSGVSSKVMLNRVTGDLAPLMSSLTCTVLYIFDMELDQAATSGLVWGLQHGVEELVLGYRVRLHIQTLLEWDGSGRCGEVTCYGDTRETYLEVMMTWAAGVNWSVSEESFWIVITRRK